MTVRTDLYVEDVFVGTLEGPYGGLYPWKFEWQTSHGPRLLALYPAPYCDPAPMALITCADIIRRSDATKQ